MLFELITCGKQMDNPITDNDKSSQMELFQ